MEQVQHPTFSIFFLNHTDIAQRLIFEIGTQVDSPPTLRVLNVKAQQVDVLTHFYVGFSAPRPHFAPVYHSVVDSLLLSTAVGLSLPTRGAVDT